MSNKLGNENGDKLKERSQLSLWATNSAIWDWDVENKRFWSSAGNQILCGHPAEEVEEPFDIDDVTNPWLLRLHPDDRVRVTQSVHDHLENDTPFDVEYRYRKSDGEYVWIHSLGRAIRDPQGRPLRMAGSNADISHRKRAEIEAQWFREAMDNASEGIVIYDESERFVYANKRYRELVPAIAHLLKPGTHREEVRKTLLSSGTLSTDADTAEQFIDEMRRSQSVGGTAELQFANGLWLKRSDYVLPEGAVVSVRTDITEIKQREQAAGKSEARYRSIYESAAVAICITDVSGNIIHSNPSYQNMLGYTAEELSVMKFRDITPAEDVNDNLALFSQLMAGEHERIDFEKRYIRKDGSMCWVEMSTSVLRDANGAVDATLSVAHDVTERKLAQQAKDISEEKYGNLFDNAHDSIFVIDPDDLSFVDVNNNAASRLGYTREELSRLKLPDIHPPDKGDRMRSNLQYVLEHGEVNFEAAHLRKDGILMPVDISSRRIEIAGRTVLQSFVRDIGERKRAEHALSESEARFRAIFQDADFGIAIATPDGRMINCNPAWSDMLGYGAGELDGKPFSYYSHPDDAAENLAHSEKLLRGEVKSFRMEKRYIRKDGSILWVNLTVSLIEDDVAHTQFRLAMIEDISERKAAEDALRESEARLADAERIAHIGSWTWDLATGALKWSDEHYRIYGIEPVGADITYEDFAAALPPEDRQMVADTAQKAIDEKTPYSMVQRIVRADGETRFVHAWGEAVFDDEGKAVQMRGAVQDITERKLDAEATRAAESRLIAILDNMPISVNKKDSSGRYDYVNPELLRNSSVTREQMLGKTAREIYPELAAMLEEKDRVVRETRSSIQFEYTEQTPSGDRHILMTKFPLMGARGEIESIVSMETDITERKRAEQALSESEQNLSAIMANIADSVVTIDEAGTILSFNQAAERAFGYRAEEIIGGRVERLMPEPHTTQHHNYLSNYLESGKSQILGKGPRELEGRRNDGSTFPIELAISEMRVGERRTFIGTIRDITQRKEVEEALRDREQMLRGIFETAAIGITANDRDGKFIQFNPAYHKMLGRSAEELSGKTFWDITHPGDHRLEEPRNADLMAGRNTSYQIDKRYLHKDGSAIWVHMNIAALKDADGSPVGSLAAVEDVTERRRAEHALAQSESRLAEAQQMAHIGNWEYIFESGRLVWSEQMYRLYGLEIASSELSNEDFLDIVHPDDRAEVKRIMGAQKSLGGQYDYDHRIVLPDGEVRFIQVRVDQMLDDSGLPIGVRGTSQDITDLKRAEEALRDSEQELRAIYDTAAVGIALTAGDGTLLRTNLAFQRMLGRRDEELKVTPFAEITHADDIERDLELFHQVLAGSLDGYQLDKRFLNRSGQPVWTSMQVAGLKNERGETVATIATVAEITERKHAEQALKESEAHLARAQEISHLGSWTWDIKADRNQWSAEHYRIFGLDPSGPAVTYDEFLAMVHEDDRGDVHAAVQETLRSGSTYDIEYRLVRADGEIRLAHAIGEVEMGENGTPIGMRGMVQDITEHAQVEEQLRQAQKMEAVGQLTGGIAHDFNNLLAVILGNLELIGDHVNSNVALRELVERGMKASERGAALTHRLLAFSRKQTLLPTTTDLNRQVSTMTDLLSRTLGETIEIRTRGMIDLWPCYTDQSQFENALLNLSINARDAMPHGGILTIETENITLDGDNALTQTEAEPGDYVVLSVSDTGSGIAGDVLEHVFEPFFTTKDVGEGSGLGLSMVYGFAKQSGGTATIESAPGEGAMVKLYLPRADEAILAPSAGQAAADIPTSRGESILVVEDDPDVRALAVQLLTGLGYEIAEAASAEAALETVNHSTRIDLLLTDVVLPGAMNGPDLATEIHRRRPAVKKLFMTGHAEQAFDGQPVPDEPTRILHKPFKMADLATTVRSALDGG